MNSVINPYYISEYLRNIFDIPKYYIFHGKCDTYDSDALLGSIGPVKILIDDTCEFKPYMTVNSIIRVTDCNEYYDLLISIDFYSMLILNDIIKTLGGVIYEKNVIQY